MITPIKEELIRLNRELEVERTMAESYLHMYNALQRSYEKLQRDYECACTDLEYTRRELSRARS
jgi:deoxyadenosine/deoxycytidine kinase